MLIAVVTTSPSSGLVQVNLQAAECERTDLDGNPTFPVGSEECKELNPIFPEAKEMIWGFGAFVVLFVALRLWLFPKVREGMAQRYASIQSDKDSAETLTAAARADVADYEARLSAVRAEAQQKIEAARATLESERSEKIAAANARIAEKRAAAMAEVDAARQAAMGDVESAVTDVVGRATELAIGKPGSSSTVEAAVRSALGVNAGATS